MAYRPTVDFFYCASSPWSYLALRRLVDTATRTSATVAFRPVLATSLGNGTPPQPGLPLSSANCGISRYARKDLQDWARFCGVEIDLPTTGSVDPTWAQRAAVLAIEAGTIRLYAETIFRACFADGRDISDLAVVTEIAAATGLDADGLDERLASDELLDALRRNAEELLQRGGFAVPTLFLGDDMYFGHDRMPLLEAALMRSAEQPFIAPGDHSG